MRHPVDMIFLHRLRSKDTAAMQEFIDQYSKPLYLLIVFLLEDYKQSEKILHRTFQAALSNVNTYDPGKENIFIWLLKQAIPLLEIDRSIIIEKFKLLSLSFD